MFLFKLLYLRENKLISVSILITTTKKYILSKCQWFWRLYPGGIDWFFSHSSPATHTTVKTSYPLSTNNLLRQFTIFWNLMKNMMTGLSRRRSKPSLKSVYRLFTVPCFFAKSFRYTASYRHGYRDFQMYRGGGRRGLSRPLPAK